jgi:uncharacterized membrane protein
LKIKDELLNKYFIMAGFLFTILAWGYVAINFSDLPDKIVGHMDLNGNINRYDSKNTLWFLLILFTGLQFGFVKFSKYITSLNPNQHSRTPLLSSIPFLGLVLIGMCYMIIQKSNNLNYNTNTMMISLAIATVVLLIFVFSYSLKSQKK